MITVNGWCAGGCGGGGIHNGEVSEQSMNMSMPFLPFLENINANSDANIFFTNSDFIQNNTCPCSLSNIS